MVESLNISIIGGGIGGLATAIALFKYGFNVQVYERARVLRPIGAGLTLTPNRLLSPNVSTLITVINLLSAVEFVI